MSRYRLTPAAKADLCEIEEYIARRSVAAASRVMAEIRAAMRRIAERPGIGHARKDLAEDTLRFWAVYSYLIIYRPDTKPLEVVRVLHGAQDVRAILENE
ncbi:MAG: type II toxin-antitoxin system RelE/ParE family toxin [Planctomycetes bacterium]|nr:type II toxin-antitoxin system RelE/ParE family toxin [Planctomycetota bacterium]